MGQENGSFVSSLALYRLGREERYAECLLPENAVVYDLGTVGGSYCAVTETGLRFVTTGGKLAGSYSYDGGYLHRCSLGGDGYAALLLGRYKSGSQGRLVTVDSQGRELASLDIDEEVMSLSAAGKYVAVLYQDHLTIYDKDLPGIRRAEGCQCGGDGADAERRIGGADRCVGGQPVSAVSGQTGGNAYDMGHRRRAGPPYWWAWCGWVPSGA